MIRPSLLDSSFNKTEILKIVTQDVGIIHHPLFSRKNNTGWSALLKINYCDDGEKMGWGQGWYVIPFLILLFYALLFVLILMITQRGSWIATDICGKFPFWPTVTTAGIVPSRVIQLFNQNQTGQIACYVKLWQILAACQLWNSGASSK